MKKNKKEANSQKISEEEIGHRGELVFLALTLIILAFFLVRYYFKSPRIPEPASQNNNTAPIEPQP
ncbi:MAG: hypothetical protein WC459_03455 [Patescibacteria group bacterium]